MNYKVIDLEQGSKPWLDFRLNKIGGSDIASICSLKGAYKTRANLLKEKITGNIAEVNEYTQKIFDEGHDWEIKVRDSVNESMKENFTPLVIQHSTINEFFVSLDGLSEDKTTCLEIKSTRKKEFLNLMSRQICPPIWEYQIQWAMYISQTFKAILAVVNSDTGDVTINEIKRDDELLEFILDRANEFRNEMLTPIDNREITLDQDETMKYISESKRVIKEYQTLIDIEEDKIKAMADKIMKDFKANKIEAHGVSIEWQERKGAINYADIPELKNVNLEKYRKKSSRHIKISVLNDIKKITKETK